MVGENNPWILEKTTTTSRMRSQNASILTSMDTWSKSVGRRKKKMFQI